MTAIPGYYEESYPPTLWGGTLATPATRANAGIPGTWVPANSTPPADPATLSQSNVTASPATPWTSGQYVQTRLAGAAGRATWTGTNWVSGAAPLIEATPATDPGAFTIPDIQAWVDNEHPELADEVLIAELDRSSPRSTLIDWLDGFIARRDAPP